MNTNVLRRAALAAGLLVLCVGLVFGQIPKKDFYGEWKMVHDGWEGMLKLGAGGAKNVVKGHYTGGDGKQHDVMGEVNDYKVTFRINMQDTAKEADDQEFVGYLFTQSRNAMAGTTVWSQKTYGWYAVKQEKEPEPYVATDTPDPVKAEEPEEPTVIMSSMGLSLTVSKDAYALGEEVVFTLKNTGDQDINLKKSYYVIQYKKDKKAKEFYTSARGPFEKLTLKPGKTKKITWDQWDNERENKAQPGQWRIMFYTPKAKLKPVKGAFRIKP